MGTSQNKKLFTDYVRKKMSVILGRFMIVVLTHSVNTFVLSQINMWIAIAYAMLILSLTILIYRNESKPQQPSSSTPVSSEAEDEINELRKKNKELNSKLWDEHVRYVKLKLEHEILQKLIDNITKRQTDR